METRTYSRHAEFKAGLHNKFYDVEAEEQPDGKATVLFRWGRIGTNGQTKTGMAASFMQAKRDCDEQFRAKLAKGYVEITAMQVIASAAESVEDRPIRGLPPVEIPTLDFKAGPSEERCQSFAKKYYDKLNIVRKSRDDLGPAIYIEQIESLIISARDEWQHIIQKHGQNFTVKTYDSLKEVFTALRTFGILRATPL